MLQGIRASRKLGQATLLSYTIDQFGHAGQMPQILQGFDIPYSVAWRGVPPGMKSVFTWRGPDGSEVLFFYSNNGYGEATALPRGLEDFQETFEATPFPRAGLRKRVTDLVAHRSPKATTRHLLCLNGIDHSFLQEDLPEIVERINRECGAVEARQSTLAEYIQEVLQSQAEAGVALATHKGELLDLNEAVLKDVHSFRADLKLANRRVEGVLEKWTEPFAAVAWLSGLAPYPAEAIRRAWGYVLENQAHDSIACSSVDKVYRHVMARYDWAQDIAEDVAAQSLLALAATGPSEPDALPLVVFNPLSWTRSEILTTTIDIPAALNWSQFRITDERGECPSVIQEIGPARHIRYNPFRGHSTVVPVRRWRATFKVGDVPALGYRRLSLRQGAAMALAGSTLFASPLCMENGILRVTVNPNGTFDLFHKPTATSYFGLHSFEDSGEAGDGYFHRPPADNRIVLSSGERAEIAIVRDTPLEAIIEVRLRFALPAQIEKDRSARSEQVSECEIRSALRMVAGGQRLDIKTTIINRAKDHRLRVLFPTGLQVDGAVSEQPFDEVSRPATVGGKMIDTQAPYDGAAKPSVAVGTEVYPQQSYVGVCDGRSGLMIANTGIYEYELTRSRALALTLLRCSDRIDAGTFVDPEFLIPQGQCLGEHTFEYSVIPHGTDRSAAREQAQAFVFPMKAVVRREVELSALPGFTSPSVPETAMNGSFVEVKPEGVVVSAVKQHEERASLVLRVFNTTEEARDGALRVAIPGWRPKQAWATNLNEEKAGRLSLDADGWVRFPLRPRGLFTIELE